VAGKQTSAFSDAGLGKDCRAPALQPNNQNDDQQYRPTKPKEQDASQHIERPLHLFNSPDDVPMVALIIARRPDLVSI
jgi:hypothetical protein